MCVISIANGQEILFVVSTQIVKRKIFLDYIDKPCFLIVSELITCKNPINIVGGFFQASINSVGAVAYFNCQIPFALIGSRPYTCSDNGQWEGNLKCGKYREGCNAILLVY